MSPTIETEPTSILSSEWYEKYGNMILITIIIGLFIDLVKDTILILLKNCLKKRNSKKEILQRKYIESITPTPFILEDSLPNLLNFFIVGIILAPGIPVLFPILGLIFFGQYWTQKFIVTRLSAKWETLGEKVIFIIRKLIPFTLLCASGSAYMLFSDLSTFYKIDSIESVFDYIEG